MDTVILGHRMIQDNFVKTHMIKVVRQGMLFGYEVDIRELEIIIAC